MNKSIDLNCDMGESYGAWTMGKDAAIMPFVSSVNIACGFHAGDPAVMAKTIEIAAKHQTAIGAHPSYPDLQGFGRREMGLTPREIYQIVIYQISALKGMCESRGERLNHVKPHGALYNKAAMDNAVSKAISKAVFDIDPTLILYGLAGSSLVYEGEKMGLRTANEVFADRTYQNNGSLTNRREPNALIENADKALAQVLQMIINGSVLSTDGETVDLKADTVCIHGDGTHALEFAKAIRSGLEKQNIAIQGL